MSLYYPSYPTCRFCGEQGIETKFVKYGRRHYAHFTCYLDAKKPLAALHKWQLESFPYRAVLDRGLGEHFDEVLKEKQDAEDRRDAYIAALRARDIAEGIE